MKDLFVDYNIALELKRLGFDKECIAYYHNHVEPSFIENLDRGETTTNLKQTLYSTDCVAPLKSKVFQWFREKHDLMYKIEWNKHYPNYPYQWTFRPIWREQVLIPYGHSGMSQTYEEAELELIKEMLNYIKNNNNE